MTERERKQTEEALKHLQAILDITNASGNAEHNHIQELRLIDRKGCKDMLGNNKRDGLFVRPVWSDSPNRDDGYYDICVEGDNAWGAVIDVMRWLYEKC